MAHRLLSLPFFALFCLLFAVIPLSTAPVFASEQAVLPDGQAFLDLVEADLASGRLSAEEALLIRFQYGFAADKLPSRYEVAGFSPLRCATPLINEYYNLRSRLSKDTVELIDNWLRPSAAKMVHLSPSGRFSLTYDTSGADAVPVADVDPANGVPDYVENVALYFDEVWAVEIDTLGFAAPPLAGGTYAVSFESMQYYGYVAIVSPVPGATRIVMHNTFVGFPGNDDPAGTAVGAGKVTAAHEFKHATQYIATRWAEGGWSELDATWVEDVVFDEVNDYYHYLTGESPLREPAVPLDGGANTTGLIQVTKLLAHGLVAAGKSSYARPMGTTSIRQQAVKTITQCDDVNAASAAVPQQQSWPWRVMRFCRIKALISNDDIRTAAAINTGFYYLGSSMRGIFFCSRCCSFLSACSEIS